MKTNVLLFTTLIFTACSFGAPSAKIVLKVVDETEMPIENAATDTIYRVEKSYAEGGSFSVDSYEKKTNKEGEVITIGKFYSPEFSNIVIEKDGYYRSNLSLNEKFNDRSYNKLLNRWEPYPCEIKIVLRKIKNPVPMYVKKIHAMRHPQKDMFVGYDLEIGDWVSPYGKGKIKDFQIKISYKPTEDGESRFFDLTFSNQLDGIIEYEHPTDKSEFRWPYESPIDGYQKVKNLYTIIYPLNKGWGGKSNINNDRKYIFRVRTKTDEQGNIISANYGYLSGEFSFYIDKKHLPSCSFFYNFNPDNKSRSLEFNGKNLFDKEEDESLKPKVRDATPEEIKEWNKSKLQ